MTYRIQVSDHLGVVDCAWGFGRKVSWSPWRTVKPLYPSREAADAAFDRVAGRGLSRWRMLYGKEVLRKSE